MPVPPFNQYLGVEVDRMEKGEADASLLVGPHHLNGRGVAHGGVISALLDTVLGAAVIASIPKEWWCATTSLTVQFLEGAREGTIVATGKVVRRGKRVAFADGEVRDGAGRLLATADAIFGEGILSKVLIPAVIAPVLAFVVGGIGIVACYRIIGRQRPGPVTRGFRFGQVLSGGLLALAHGTNDAQKTMGVIVAVLVAAG